MRQEDILNTKKNKDHHKYTFNGSGKLNQGIDFIQSVDKIPQITVADCDISEAMHQWDVLIDLHYLVPF